MVDVKVDQKDMLGFSPIFYRNPETTLAKGAEILNKLELNWWIDAGTLLGFVRNNEFIAHDTDIDVSTNATWMEGAIKDAFKKAGFKQIREVSYGGVVYQMAFEDPANHNVIFDIEFYKEFEDGWRRYNEYGYLLFPRRFFDGIHSRDFKYGTYRVPGNEEEYLEYRYVDWKVPRETKTPWNEYTKNEVKC